MMRPVCGCCFDCVCVCVCVRVGDGVGEEGAVRDETAQSRQHQQVHWSVHRARTRLYCHSVLLAGQPQGTDT